MTDVDRQEDAFAAELAAHWAAVRAENPSLPAISFEPFHRAQERKLALAGGLGYARVTCPLCCGEVGKACTLCLGVGYFDG